VKSVKVLDVTGGEPLLRKDIHEVLAYARKAGFRKIILNTNGLLLDSCEDCLKYVDTLSISLDSLSPKKLQEIYHVDETAITKILNNINSTVTGVLLVQKNGSDIMLSWQPIQGISLYNIYRAVVPNPGSWDPPLWSGTSTACTDPVIANPDNYYYHMQGTSSCD